MREPAAGELEAVAALRRVYDLGDDPHTARTFSRDAAERRPGQPFGGSTSCCAGTSSWRSSPTGQVIPLGPWLQ